MKLTLTVLFAVLFAIDSFGQKITFVSDSIMDVYMKNGYANKHFMPKGKEDTGGKRQGYWKDYEVVLDFTYVSIDNEPEQISAYYLLYAEGKFVDDKREGLWRFYVLEDKSFRRILQKEVMYVSGEETGLYKYYFPNGKISQTGDCDESKVTDMKVYYPNGKIFRNTQFYQGIRNGKSTSYYLDGKVSYECNYVGDSLDGSFISYHPNGNKAEISFFKNGAVDGTYQYYYENGRLWIEKEYRDDRLLNIKFNYDEFGNPRDFGTLKDGNGTVKYYTTEGVVYAIEEYKDGVKISESGEGDFK